MFVVLGGDLFKIIALNNFDPFQHNLQMLGYQEEKSTDKIFYQFKKATKFKHCSCTISFCLIPQLKKQRIGR